LLLGFVVRLGAACPVLCFFVIVASILLVPVSSRAVELPNELTAAVKKASSSVVNVAATRMQLRNGDESRSLGTGFVVDASGLIVTNGHVIAGSREIHVTFGDGTRRGARVAGIDAASDLALLKVSNDRKFEPLILGDSDGVLPGDWVIAIGGPFGFGGSVSAGVVSARNRQIGPEFLEDYIQTDAAINRGSSGGPLLNLKGEVVGVNSALISPNGGSAGVGFAVPSSTLRFVIARIKQRGIVQRGWVGVSVLDLTPDLADAFGLEKAAGALIGSVVAGGPLAKAGIVPGDVITGAGGRLIVDARDFQRYVAEAESGKSVNFSLVRRRQAMQATAVVGLRPGDRVPVTPTLTAQGPLPGSFMGLGLEDLTPVSRGRLGLGSASNGVLVRQVEPATPASEADIRAGDLIVEISQRGVSRRQDVRDLVKGERASGKRFALVTVSREGVTLFKALRLSEQLVDAQLSR